ncbi:uncharacterized protein [Salminus brasiliensis]|uniref:uncharacterized protein isoform X2 n=1 Tax=Salminus brasiliensis TaxID=930266 RepID=UPI003B82C742
MNCGCIVLYSIINDLFAAGVSVLAEESTERRAAGSSLILPLGYPKESVSFAQWKYEGITFASYRNGQIRITNELQFSGRLKVDNENLSVEVTDLQLRDSGRYSITADKTGDQLPTKTTSLTVYGLSVLAEESTERRAAGSSLILPLGYPKETVSYAQWKYEGSTFASYRNGQIRITNELQFSGRLKMDNENLSVEVTDLQLRDSGRYSIIADKTGDQLPTKTTSLTVYGLLKIEIESSQTWKESTNSCEVHLVCRAPEDQMVSYRWSGYKVESGDHLNFTLTPADGDVILNCTASSSLRNGSNTTRVKCRPKESPTDRLTDNGNTVYADVNTEGTVTKDQRSQSINIASIYETVDEHRITSDKPQTLYDKVTFARPNLSGPSMSSPYQEVL